MRLRDGAPPITCRKALRMVGLAELGLTCEDIAEKMDDDYIPDDIEWTLWALGYDPAKNKHTERILRELRRERRCVGAERSSLPKNDVLLAAWDILIGRRED